MPLVHPPMPDNMHQHDKEIVQNVRKTLDAAISELEKSPASGIQGASEAAKWIEAELKLIEEETSTANDTKAV